MPAFYIPIILMLLGLIFRGVAFEFRFKSDERDRKIWDIAFHGGSLLAAFMQGMILGNFVMGVEVVDRAFAGSPLDWANGFAVMTGIAMVFGYALLGSTWLILKTEDETKNWAIKIAKYCLVYVGLAMIFISVSMPFIDDRISLIWFTMPNFIMLLPIPILTAICFIILWNDLSKNGNDARPFFITVAIFFLGYLGLGISLYPWIVPFAFTVWDAAAVSTSQSLLLIGAVVFLPIILGYTAYNYYVFRGKAGHEKMY
jgi:cytochrome d ubiquinol oxidase subunit II